jgi:DNA-binding helix-hairpin-helix protein with protein kinase domain
MTLAPTITGTRLASSGRPCPLGARLAPPGGEGEVLEVVGEPGLACKRYRRELPSVAAKLAGLQVKVATMIEYPPVDPTRPEHVSLVWPSDLVLDDDGRFVGFVMPRVDRRDFIEIHRLTNPSDRAEASRSFTWEYLVATAANLATAVVALHDAGHVAGDLNERNILVDRRALVTLVDCDSMQVFDPLTGRLLPCVVGRPEWLAPELLGAELATVERTEHADDFALAVHVYRCLMEGWGPFDGRWHGRGDKPRPHQAAAMGLFAQRGDRRLTPPPDAPPFSILPRSTRQLFHRAFVRGARHPEARPTAREWQRELLMLQESVVECPTDPYHVFSDHLRRCPWCDPPRPAHDVPAPPGAYEAARAALRQRVPAVAVTATLVSAIATMWSPAAPLAAAVVGVLVLSALLLARADALPSRRAWHTMQLAAVAATAVAPFHLVPRLRPRLTVAYGAAVALALLAVWLLVEPRADLYANLSRGWPRLIRDLYTRWWTGGRLPSALAGDLRWLAAPAAFLAGAAVALERGLFARRGRVAAVVRYELLVAAAGAVVVLAPLVTALGIALLSAPLAVLG